MIDDQADDKQPEATAHIITRLSSAEPVPPEMLPANTETLTLRFANAFTATLVVTPKPEPEVDRWQRR
jgi:hypothetical protein